MVDARPVDPIVGRLVKAGRRGLDGQNWHASGGWSDPRPQATRGRDGGARMAFGWTKSRPSAIAVDFGADSLKAASGNPF